jgi:hypothetical protein
MRKQKLAGLLAILVFFSAEAQAETKKSKIWKVSAAILGAVTIADMQSSMGRPEANPLLRSGDGRFAGRGVALKGVLVGAAVGGQWLMLRKVPNASGYAAGANFAAAAITGAVVARNHMLK